MWIKLWMKNNMSHIALLCHLLYIQMSLQYHLAHPYGLFTDGYPL